MTAFNAIEIKTALKERTMFLISDVLLTENQYSAYCAAKAKSELADLQQGVRKVLL